MAGFLLFLVLIAPVDLGAAVDWGAGGLRLRLGVRVWGVRVQGEIVRQPQGFALRLPGRTIRLAHSKRKRRGAVFFLRLWKKTGAARRLLFRGVRVQGAGQMELGGENAAHIAWWAGWGRCVCAWLPGLRLQVVPRFDGGPSSFRGKCIVQTRLGILLAAWILGAAALRKKEETPWSIPSAA